MAYEIYIDDVIGTDFFGDGITAAFVRDELRKADGEDVLLRFDSPGGSVFEGSSILTHLSQYAGRVLGQIDGVAASCASWIACACEELAIADGAWVMIHDPWSACIGDHREMGKEAALLDKMGTNLAASYASKTGKSPEEMRQLMLDVTWWDADEAVAAGFADSKIATISKAVAIAKEFGYKNVPSSIAQYERGPLKSVVIPPIEAENDRSALSAEAMRRRISLMRAKQKAITG